MRIFYFTASALTLSSAMAMAGGVDRSGQSTTVLFEEGRVLQVSFGSVKPDVSGVATEDNADSGSMMPAFAQTSAAYKADIADNLSYALIIDQPYGADIDYPSDTGYYGEGTNATLRTTAITALAKIRNSNNISFFGGLRAQAFEADAYVHGATPDYTVDYRVTGAKDWGFGWVAGVAWEKPEIAARLSLTINSEIDHELATTEEGTLTVEGTEFPFNEVSDTAITTPQSINLEFQTGIAKDTLLFGSVRRVEWTTFSISPELYSGVAGPLVRFPEPTLTYSLGLGRRLTEQFSIALSGTHEAPYGGFSSNLGPVDGRNSYGIAAIYSVGNAKIAAGVQHVEIGDAQTSIDGDTAAANFTDNSALAYGLKVTLRL